MDIDEFKRQLYAGCFQIMDGEYLHIWDAGLWIGLHACRSIGPLAGAEGDHLQKGTGGRIIRELLNQGELKTPDYLDRTPAEDWGPDIDPPHEYVSVAFVRRLIREGRNMELDRIIGQYLADLTGFERTAVDEDVKIEVSTHDDLPASQNTARGIPRKKLVERNRARWPTIEADISKASENGLSSRAKAGNRGWIEVEALAWAEEAERLVQVHELHGIWPASRRQDNLD